MNTLSSTLIWCAIQATVLACLTAVMCSRPLRLGGASAPLFGLCAIVVLTIAAFLPMPHWFTPDSISELVTTQLRSQGEVGNQNGSSETLPDEPESSESEAGSAIRKSTQKTEPSFASAWLGEWKSEANKSGSSEPRSDALSKFVVWGFFVGAVFGLFRLMLGWIGTYRLQRQSQLVHEKHIDELMSVLCAELSIRTPVVVYETNQLTTAATLGAIRPVILLPMHWREWNTDEITAVLAHELAHVKHRDFAAQLLSQLGVVLHFYNPIVHWLSSRLRLEQELAADSTAAQLAGGNRQYVRLLAKLALDHENQNVGWPARAFLPTRQTFLRRLEMLRNSKATPARRYSVGRWISLAMIGLGAIALMGIRPQGNAAIAQAPSGTTAATQSTVPYDLKYVSNEGGVLLLARPAVLLADPTLANFADDINQLPNLEDLRDKLGLEPKDIEQIVVGTNVVFAGPEPVPSRMSLSIKTSKPIANVQSLIGGTAIKIGTATVYELPNDMCVWLPDENTLVMNNKRNIQRFIEGRKVETKLTNTAIWKQLQDQPAVLLLDGEIPRSMLSRFRQDPNFSVQFLPVFAPIIDEADMMGVAASVGSQFKVTAFAQCTDEKGVQVVQETASAALVLLKNGLKEVNRQFMSQPANPLQPVEAKQVIAELTNIAGLMLESASIKTTENMATLTFGVDSSRFPTKLLITGVSSARKAAQRTQSTNNLKQIGLAFHNHHDALKQFPDSKYTFGQHKYPCSWRVAILPYIEQVALYQQYNFDEPWDSENNLKVLHMMPAIYRHPSEPETSTNTSYVVLSGPDMIFGSSKKPQLQTITDGTSNTIMVVEAKTSIPWTKPEDFEYAANGKLPQFGGYSEEGYNVVFGDGSVRFISKLMDEKMLRILLTPRDGQAIPNF